MADWIGSIPDSLLPSGVATGGDINFLEGVSGGYGIGRATQSQFMPSNIVRDLLQPTIDELNARGEDLSNPGTYLNRSGASEQLDSVYDDYWFQHHLGRLNDAIARNGGDGTDPIDVDTLKKQVRLRAQQAEAYADEMGLRTTTLGELGSIAGQFGAAGVDILNDPTTAPIMLSGFVRNVAVQGPRFFTARMAGKRALIEGMIGMGTEAWMQSGVAKWRQEFGLNYDFGDFVTAVGMSGLLGGALGGTVEAGSVVARGGRMGIMAREVARSIDETTIAQIHQRMLNLSDDAIVSGARALRAAGVDVSPELKFAADERQAGEEIIRVNPLAGEDADIEHARRAIEADVALKAGVPEAMPTVTPIAKPKTPVDIYEADNLDETVYRFRPDEIGVDAKTFQFKEGGDEFGVTERLAGVTKWDPIKAGQIVVYEFADGRRVIADGHQRLGLAKRIMAQDPSQKPVIYGSLIREADGFSPDQARLIAALKNIAEGTGTAVDAAKVLRIDPARLSELPPRSQLVRQAQDLVNLSDEAFGLVINGVTAPHYAAIVGRLVPDQAKQMAILRLLSDADPQNVIQAEAIIRQALEADFEQAVQVGLFGEELITESLFKERARVLDAALKTLRKDRAIFNSLVENQSRIEGAGNVLDQAENLQRSTTDAQAIALIQKVANRRGDLSDALSAAARELKQSGSIREPSRSFVEAVRRSIERGDFNGVDAGGEGRFVDVEAEGDLIAASPRQDELDRFDDPIHGEGVSRQADQLERDFVSPDPNQIQADWRLYLEPTADSIELPIASIVPIRARPQGIANARVLMAQAARGETTKRGPLTVKDNGDGSYTLLDGNSTYAIATEAGMQTVPVRVVTDQQFAQEVAQKNAAKIIELGPDAKKKRVVLAQDLAPAELRHLAFTLQSRQAYASIDDIVERNNTFNAELNQAVKGAAGEHDVEYHPGPAKERVRIEEKVRTKYAGDLNRIADASRASVTVARPDEADAFIKELGKTYHIVDEGYKGAPAGTEAYSGYFDRKLMVINNDGVIGEVIIIERGLFDAKHNRGGHALYEIVRGDNNLDKAFAKIPDEALRSRLQALRDDRPALKAAANQAMIELYQGVLPQIDPSFGQVVGNVLRLPPNTANSVSNSAAVSSSVRVSDSSSSAKISPQAPSDFNMNAAPSSRRTVGIRPSSEKNLIGPTSAENISRQDAAINSQTDLIPVGQRIDPDTGELVPEYKSKAELLDEIRQDEAMLARFEGCVA